MKKYFFLIVVSICFASPLIFAEERSPVVSPQFEMVGARQHSIGTHVPTISDDVSSVFVNPAAIGDVTSIQTHLMNQSVFGHFDYTAINFAMPLGDFSFSASYGSNMLDGIPMTVFRDDVISEVDTYSSGWRTYHFALAESLYFNWWIFDKFSYGFAAKAFEQVLGDQSRFAYGIDAGIISTMFMPGDILFDKVHIGLSIINLFGTDLPKWTISTAEDTEAQGGENPVARQLFLGTRFDMLDEKLSLFFGLYGISQVDEYSLGAEYYLSNNFVLRTSMISRTVDVSKYPFNLGTGLILENIAGFGYEEYDLRLDYNYAQHPEFQDDITHTFSIAFLGESRDPRPRFIKPLDGVLTNKSAIDLQGRAKAGSQLVIYRNTVESTRVRVDEYGRWSVTNFPLVEGKNRVYLKSQSKSRNISKRSKVLDLISDTQAPELLGELRPSDKKNILTFSVRSSEPLQTVKGSYLDRSYRFFNRGNNQFSFDFNLPEAYRDGAFLPEQMATFSVTAKDYAGNTSQPYLREFLVAFNYPKDKTITFSNKITLRGVVSHLVEGLKVNGERVPINKANAFLYPMVLNYGKNMLKIEVDLGSHNYTYYARLLTIQRFPDIERTRQGRRDVEFLASMGFVEPREDGNFYPDEPMTRIDIAKLLVNQKKLTVTEPEFSPFLDVPLGDPNAGYILAAVNEGLLFAFPDGTFRPNAPLTVEEAHNLLVNNDIIQSEDTVVDTAPISRFDFAMMLKQVPQYEKRLEFLADWEQGFVKE